jgi:hypothetical protein
MALGTPTYSTGTVDTNATLGPTTGIVAGSTPLNAVGTNQGDQLGITNNLINTVINLETNALGLDTYLQQTHCDVGPATLVTATQYGGCWITLAASGTATRVIGTAGHPGQYQLATSATDSGRSEMSSHSTIAEFQTGFFTALAFRCVVLTPGTLPTTTACVFRAGFCDALGVGAGVQPVNGIEWVFYPSTNAFWNLQLTKASTTTNNATAITVATSTWYDLEILITSAGVQGRCAVYSPTALPTLFAGGPYTTNQPLTTTSMFWHVLAMNNSASATSFIYTADLAELSGQPATGPVGPTSNYRGQALTRGF